MAKSEFCLIVLATGVRIHYINEQPVQTEDKINDFQIYIGGRDLPGLFKRMFVS